MSKLRPPKRSNNFPKITQLIRGKTRSGSKIHAAALPSPLLHTQAAQGSLTLCQDIPVLAQRAKISKGSALATL